MFPVAATAVLSMRSHQSQRSAYRPVTLPVSTVIVAAANALAAAVASIAEEQHSQIESLRASWWFKLWHKNKPVEQQRDIARAKLSSAAALDATHEWNLYTMFARAERKLAVQIMERANDTQGEVMTLTEEEYALLSTYIGGFHV